MEDLKGILIVDKEKGMTSHDVVDLVRKRFKIKKVGHAGTLDPNATGVLVLLLGKATKLSNRFLSEDKEYEAVIKLGERTSTSDSDGEVLERMDVTVSTDQIKTALKKFEGEIEQVPPMVSAKKVNGKRLYKLARKGLEVERKPVKVFIEKIDVLKIEGLMVHIRVICSKGTYIRQLAEDVGAELAVCAHLSELRRTRSGDFGLDGALSVSSIRKMDKDTLNESIIRI